MRLVEPLPVGRRDRVAPSRVMFGPHETNLGVGRAFSDRHVAYYGRRAAGGTGIIVTEEASVHESDWPYERAPLATACEPGWSAIVAACAPTGTLVLAGLGHSGGQGTSHWSQRELWAPSPVPEVASREVPKVMEDEDVDAVIRGFALAATSAVRAGCDGVEINAGQFSLVRQFLSALTNMRNDPYGEDRLRFARDVLTAVRAAAGDVIVALRLSCDEMAPWAGVVPDAAAAIAVELAKHVDLLTVVRGSIYTGWATRPDQHEPPGFAIGLARSMRAALREAGSTVPVVAQGSIVDPDQAEWAIGDGACDAVEMTRAQLADAHLVSKLRAGSSARIRPCLLCNQTCKVRDNRNPIVTCVVDPRTGHETEDPPEPTHAGGGRPVTVIGAGVAGLEAARIAALRGRSVHVIESGPRTGGVARVAAQAHGRDRLDRIADWLQAECENLGVRIELGRRVDDDELDSLRARGSVIVTTGARQGNLPFEVHQGATVLDAVDVLVGLAHTLHLPASGPIAVWDPIGGPIAIGVAETLAARGHVVTLLTPDLLVGEKLALTGDLAPAQVRLHAAGVTMVKRAIVRAVHRDAVEIEDRFSGDMTSVAAVALVACGHRLPDEAIDPSEQHMQAGDRVAPRTIHEAILEGRRVGMSA